MQTRTRRTVVGAKAVRTAKKVVEIRQSKTGMNKTAERVPAPTQKALKLLKTKSKTDVLGSYTGKPMDKGDKPTQDADDL